MGTGKNLVKLIRNSNARNAMWQRGDTIVVGVSGGRDSICLLDVLNKIAHKEQLTLVIAHVNYGLRGINSDLDEELVRETAKAHSLVFHSLKVTDNSATDENSLRAIRREYFARICASHNAKIIALGHHREDQAESILMNIIRGTGTTGLSGMKHVSPMRLADQRETLGRSETLSLVHPLLTLSRIQIDAHCEKYALRFRNDDSNLDCKYLRNRVRHELLPLLKSNYNPQIVKSLSNLSQIISSGLSEDVGTHSIPWSVACLDKKPIIVFSRSVFTAATIHQQQVFLQEIFGAIARSAQSNVTAQNLPFSFIDECRVMIGNDKTSKAEICAHSLIVTRKNDTVRTMFA